MADMRGSAALAVGGRRAGSEAPTGGFYLGPWQEYALWRVHMQQTDARLLPATIALAANDGHDRAFPSDRRSTCSGGSSFSRSLMSMSPSTPQGPASSRSVMTETTTSDGQSSRSSGGAIALRRAGAHATRQPVPRVSKPTPSQNIDAQDRMQRLRMLYGMAPPPPREDVNPHQTTSQPQAQSSSSQPERITQRSQAMSANKIELLDASVHEQSGGGASATDREARLVALLEAQSVRQAALEAQLQRQQAVSTQMSAALARLSDIAPPLHGDKPRPPCAFAGSTVAAADVEPSWLPVRAVVHSGPQQPPCASSADPPALSALPVGVSCPSLSLSQPSAAPVGHGVHPPLHPRPPPTVASAAPQALAHAGTRLGGVDHFLRFMGPAAVNASAMATTRSRTDASQTTTLEAGAVPAVARGAALQAHVQRRGSLPEAGVADDLLNWSATLQTGSPV